MPRPTNQLELIEDFGIPRLSGPNGQKFIGCVFAAINDMLVEGAATALRAALLYDVNPRTPDEGGEQPFTAIELLGQEAMLPLYPGEAHSSLATQLRRKWDHWSGGIKDALISELARAGYEAIISTPLELDLTPTIVSSGSIGSSTGTNSRSPLAEIEGDLMILQVETSNEPILAPIGWTQIASVGVGGAGTTGTRLQIFTRIAESSDEPDVAIPDAGDHSLMRLTVVRGAGTSVDVSIAQSADADVTDVSIDAVDVELPQSLVLLVVATSADASGGQLSAQANPEMTGVNEEADSGSTTGNGGGLSLTSGLRATAGPGGTWTATLATPARWAACSLTIAPRQYWSRFWVGILNSPLTGPGLSWGAHRVGLDKLGPSGMPENYLDTLRKIVAQNKPSRWIPWEFAFPLTDGTVRIKNPLTYDPTHVYFS